MQLCQRRLFFARCWPGLRRGISRVIAYLAVTTLALEATAEVVHDDVGTSAAKEDGICASETTTGTGDNDGLAVPAQFFAHDAGCDVRTSKERNGRGVGSQKTVWMS